MLINKIYQVYSKVKQKKVEVYKYNVSNVFKLYKLRIYQFDCFLFVEKKVFCDISIEEIHLTLKLF